jgi:hypothetical protein
MAIANHLIYLVLSIAFTVLVGQSLYTNGRPFLMECLGNAKTADAVNRFFLLGFYLMNSAFIFFALRFGETGATLEQSLEMIAGRVGFVALVMGGMHFNNLYWCEFVRQKRDLNRQVNLR